MNKTLIWRGGQRIAAFYRDRDFYTRLYTIALPITLQNFISSLLSMVGIMMIGQLGETAVASVGLANQIFFLLMLLLFGINSGSAMFTAQLWGKHDVHNIRRVLGLALTFGLISSFAFFLVAEFAPELALGIYSKDPAVVALGSEYLRIFGFSFMFTAVTFCFSAILRSVGEVKTPLVVSLFALAFNTLLSYGLIFGVAGLPRMGAKGVAVAICIARFLECSALLWVTYRRRFPPAASLKEMTGFDSDFARKIILRVLPVAVNEVLWSLGITTYNIVYARIGTESIAAVNIAATIDNLALVIFIGISHGCAVLVGNRIGAEEEQKAFRYGAITLTMGVAGAILAGIAIRLGAGLILSFYKVSPVVILNAKNILLVISALLWLRVSNMILFIGIFRAGGDTRFALLLDGVMIWLVGVPSAFVGAFVLDLPVYLVYLMVLSEEFVKWGIGMFRFSSRKWIHNLVVLV